MENRRGGSCQLRLRMGPPLPVQCTPDQRQMRGHRRVRNPPGYYGNVTLDGVRFVRVYSWPASIPEGNGTRMTIIDDRASADQRAALLALDGAKEGGLYFEIFASVCPNVLEPMFARLEIKTDRERRRAKVIIPDVLESRVEPILNPVTGEEHRARIVLPNGFEYKEAEIGNTVSFEVKAPRELAMRHQNTYAQLKRF